MRFLTPDGGGDTTVVVQTEALNGAKEPVCEVADAAVNVAADQLNQGQLPRRSLTPPADSLLHQDACAMLDTSVLSVVPGIDASHPASRFGGWRCVWETTSKVELGFGA